MDVKEATHIARAYITDVFADEEIAQLGLEEAVYDDTGQWRITYSFARPWDKQGVLGLRMGLKVPRDYKVVTIDDRDGRVISLTDQLMPEIVR